MLVIRQAEGAGDMDEVRALWTEYAQSLDFSLCFQSFDKELAGLPGDYAPPRGRLYLAEWEGAAAGAIAMRPLAPGRCEMKRLYVRPPFRGHKIGEALVERLLDEAKASGYTEMVLDTVPRVMGKAIELYRRFGFVDAEVYTANPVEGAIYLARTL